MRSHAIDRVIRMPRSLHLALATALLASGFVAIAPPAAASECYAEWNDCFDWSYDLGSSRPRSFGVENTYATLEAGEPLSCGVAGASVWFKFTASTSGTARVKLTGTAGFDVALTAYAGINLDGLSFRSCSGGTTGVQVAWSCVAGTTYQIQVASGTFNRTGYASFVLEGCGATGPTVSNGVDLIVGTHENRPYNSCSVSQAGPQVCTPYGYDINARATVDKTPTTPSAQGGIVTFRTEDSVRVYGQSRSTGEVMLVIGPGGGTPPPPPPGCGVGCEPRDLVTYTNAMVDWIMEQLP